MNVQIMLQYICCPECKGTLRTHGDGFVCNRCLKQYAVRDSIPILLPKKLDRLSLKVRRRYETTEGGDSLSSVFPIISKLTMDIKGKEILDVGCSQGNFVFHCLLKKEPKVVIGLDFSFNAVRVANSKITTEQNVGFLVATALNLPLRNNRFDIIVISEVIEHLTNVESCLLELKRCLKENGHIILSTSNYFNLVGIVKKMVDRHYYKGRECYSYAQVEELERFFTPFTLKKLFSRHNLKIMCFRGSDMYYGVRNALLFPLAVLDRALVRLTRIARFDFLTRSPLKYLGAVQYYKLQKQAPDRDPKNSDSDIKGTHPQRPGVT